MKTQTTYLRLWTISNDTIMNINRIEQTVSELRADELRTSRRAADNIQIKRNKKKKGFDR